eukprot:m.127962 g.127962  ORF g.127962 m.127962 type:complete len:369 (-) comp11220_c0_seq5:596-1702(-)
MHWACHKGVGVAFTWCDDHRYGSLLSHLHFVRLVEVHCHGVIGGGSPTDANYRRASLLRDFETDSGIPEFSKTVVADVLKQHSKSMSDERIVSHLMVGTERFEPDYILRQSAEVIEEVRVAVETGVEITVHYFFKIDGWRLVPIVKHVQYVETGTFAQLRPIWIREQEIPLDSYVFTTLEAAQLMHDAYRDCGLSESAGGDIDLVSIRTDNANVVNLLTVLTHEASLSLTGTNPRAAEVMRGPFEIAVYVAILLESVQDLLSISHHLIDSDDTPDPRRASFRPTTRAGSTDDALPKSIALMTHATLHKYIELCGNLPVLRVPHTLSNLWALEAANMVTQLLEVEYRPLDLLRCTCACNRIAHDGRVAD